MSHAVLCLSKFHRAIRRRCFMCVKVSPEQEWAV